MPNSILRRTASPSQKGIIIAVAVSLTVVAIIVGVVWMLIRKNSRTRRGHADDTERYPVHHNAGISEHEHRINENGILALRMSEIINRPPAALTGSPRRREFCPNEMNSMRRHTTQEQISNCNYHNNKRRHLDGDSHCGHRASNATSEEYGTGCCDGLIGYPTRSQSESHLKPKVLGPRVYNQQVASNGSPSQYRRNPSSQSQKSTRSRSKYGYILYPPPPHPAAALAEVQIPSIVSQPPSSHASNSPPWSPTVPSTKQEWHEIAPFTDYKISQPKNRIYPWKKTETPTTTPPISPILPGSSEPPLFSLARNTYEFIPDVHPGTLATCESFRRPSDTPSISPPSTISSAAESSQITPQHWWTVLSGNISQRIRHDSANIVRKFQRLSRGSRAGTQGTQSQQSQSQSQQSPRNHHEQGAKSWRQVLQNLQFPFVSENRRQSEQLPSTQPMQPPQPHQWRRLTASALNIATSQPHQTRREAETRIEHEMASGSEPQRNENKEAPNIVPQERVYSPSMYPEDGSNASSLSLDEVLTSTSIMPAGKTEELPSNVSSPTLGYDSAITVSSALCSTSSAAKSVTGVDNKSRRSCVSVAEVSSEDESTMTEKAAPNVSAISTWSLSTEAHISPAILRQEANWPLKAVLQPEMPSNASSESLYISPPVISPALPSTHATSNPEEAIRAGSTSNKLNQEAPFSSLTSVASRTSRFIEEDVDIDTTPCAPHPTPTPRTVHKNSSSSLASRASFTSQRASRFSEASRRASQISLASLPPVPYPTPAPGFPVSTPTQKKLLQSVSTEQLHLRAASIRAKLNQSPSGPLSKAQLTIPRLTDRVVTKRRWEAVGGRWMKRSRIVTPQGTLE
ncbi:hypothetical protein BZA77DRAFT_348920 [Pyronema omphalodes]|nr:hypothetical protein BZA77DRAFT_348920 [Pyronema omphalodes]